MKKLSLIIAAAMLLVCVSCRKDADVIPNPDLGVMTGYLSYEGQFLAIWHGINSSYAHWSEDTVDWDARYQRLYPRVVMWDNLLGDSSEFGIDFVPYDTFADLYTQLFEGLLDHHAYFYVKNIITDPEDPREVFTYSPGNVEVQTRDYYHPRVGVSAAVNALLKLQDAGRVTELMYVTSDENFQIVSCLIDGKYPFLRMSNYEITDFVDEEDQTTENWRLAEVYRHWIEMCSRPTTKGIILDNRSNTGGYAHDLNYVVSPFLSEDIVPAYTRTKNGLHRYDYTPWAPMTVHKAETTVRSDVPYVVLADVWSVSMGEISTAAIKYMPNGYFIGERTFGGHGALDGMFSRTFTGTFGSMDDYHFVYTTTYQCKFVDGGILEGKGISPNKEVRLDVDALIDNHDDNQLQAALEYLNGVK